MHLCHRQRADETTARVKSTALFVAPGLVEQLGETMSPPHVRRLFIVAAGVQVTAAHIQGRQGSHVRPSNTWDTLHLSLFHIGLIGTCFIPRKLG